MRRKRFVLVIFVVSFFASAAFGQVSYETYSNARFAYSIEFPASLMVAQEEAANADGRIFLAKKGTSELRVWGQYKAFGHTLRKAFQNDIDNRGGHITYKALLKDGYVISGTKANRIFYQKTLFKGQSGDRPATIATFLIEYDNKERSTYDAVVARLSKSFKFE